MRKITTAALVALALCLIYGAGSALAGDCCNKCKPCKTSCNDGCKKACDSCKPKCDPCKPKCDPCKPKCSPCKPKCNPCAKPKCGGCDKCAKPSCGGCGKCNSCKPACGGCGKCGSCKPDCWGDKGSYWNGDACCPPKQCPQQICLDTCSSCGGGGCGDCSGKARHPYERCWNGSSMMCDTGCCNAYLPCKRQCVTCETVCKEVETTDCCGCKTKHYVYETVCHEVKRPTVIPWWFNEKGAGNIYVEDKGEAAKTADSGADTTETASSGWSGGSEG